MYTYSLYSLLVSGFTYSLYCLFSSGVQQQQRQIPNSFTLLQTNKTAKWYDFAKRGERTPCNCFASSLQRLSPLTYAAGHTVQTELYYSTLVVCLLSWQPHLPTGTVLVAVSVTACVSGGMRDDLTLIPYRYRYRLWSWSDIKRLWLILEALFRIRQSCAVLLCFSSWAQRGGHSSGFSRTKSVLCVRYRSGLTRGRGSSVTWLFWKQTTKTYYTVFSVFIESF